MTDKQQDKIKELEAIGELMQAINETATISAESISYIGDLIIRLTLEICT